MQEKKPSAQTGTSAGDPVTKAHEEAEKDIQRDPDVNLEPKPTDDLDEGELATLEEED